MERKKNERTIIFKHIIYKIVSYTTWYSEIFSYGIDSIKLKSSAFISVRAERAGSCSNH